MKARHALSWLSALFTLVGLGTTVLAQDTPPNIDGEGPPNVRISPTGVVDGKVLIARTVADGPSWVVIHADDEGEPGEVIGYAPVGEGETLNIPVEVDTEAVTPILHAMLHDDLGEVGVFEFPGADTPTTIEDDIVMAAFSALPVPAESEPMEPDVQISPEGVVNEQVIITRAATAARSWVVIYNDDDGEPGEVIGYAPLNEGENLEVLVDIDAEAATPVLYAMLHDDNGEEGVFEFPGVDTPTELNGDIVMASFSSAGVPEEETSTGTGGPVEQGQRATLMAGAADDDEADDDAADDSMAGASTKGGVAPTSMPVTGGTPSTAAILMTVVSLLAVLAGGTLIMRRGHSLRP